MAVKLFGIAGAAGAGKDTVATLLSRHGNYYHYAFAKPLKEALAVLGIKEPANRADKELNLPGKAYSYRTAAQRLGTEWARTLDENFWGNLAETFIETHDKVVISDVRFENEAAMIRNRGGTIIHVVGRATTVQGENATHASERPILVKDGDIVLDNSRGIHELVYKVLEILRNTERP